MPPSVRVSPADPPRAAVTLLTDDRPIIIHLRQVRKVYDIGTPRETEALRGIDLDISLAEIVVIFGASGSGKSTLLNILAGLDTATSGLVEVDGKNLAKLKPHDLALYHQFKVGMVFQAYNLVPTFTVMQNITMPARLAGFKREAYLKRGWDLLKQFKLEPLAHRLPSECSGGQEQRVGIMRAFINRPAFIIADEPTGNLDSVSSEHIMQLFKQLNRETNTTMLIVTHDSSVFSIADRVVHVLDGRVTKQTILTTKAKIDPKTMTVPVEYRYRPEDKQELIKSMQAGKTPPKPGAAPVALPGEPAIDMRRRYAHLQQLWTHVRQREQALSLGQQRLDHERAVILKEGRRLERERERILVAELSLHQSQQQFATETDEQTEIARRVIADEIKRLERTERRQQQAAARLQAELADQERRLSSAAQALARQRQETTTKQQTASAAHQAALAHLSQLQQARDRLQAEQTTLARRQQALASDRQAMQAEQAALTQAKAVTDQAQAVLAGQRQVVQSREQWLTAEETRLRHQESTLAATETELEETRSAADREFSRQRRELTAAATRLQTGQQELQRERQRLEKEQQALTTARTALQREQQALSQQQQVFDLKTQRKLSAATDIIDHEREQLETERQQQLQTIQQRSRVTERKLAAARQIISRELAVIKQEHALLQQERRLLQLEQDQLEQERKKPSSGTQSPRS